MNAAPEAWVGLVEVEPFPDTDPFDGAPGAFANAVCVVGSDREFRRRVGAFFVELRLRVVEFDKVEPLRIRLQKFYVPAEIRILAKEAQRTGIVDYDRFYIYRHDDE